MDKRFLAFVIGAFMAVSFIDVADAGIVKRGASCAINGTQYNDGQVFSLPGSLKCVKYICENGLYRFYEDSCEFNQKCYPVNQQFDIDCIKYSCTKTVNGTTSTYSVSSVGARCKDRNGVCYNPGEFFSLVINSRIWSKCTCAVQADNSIKYSCSG